jgi:hypothetical protein
LNAKLTPIAAAQTFAREYFAYPTVLDSIESELELSVCYRGVFQLHGDRRTFKLLGLGGLWAVCLA